MTLFIEELGLTPTTTITAQQQQETGQISMLGDLLRQPELLQRPVRPLDWSTYHRITTGGSSSSNKRLKS